MLHPAEGPRPFWEPTRPRWGDDEDDEDGRDVPEEEDVTARFGATFYVAHAVAADVAIAFLPILAGAPGDDGDLCVAYVWPRPEPGELHPVHPVPQGIWLHAALLTGEGALVRASRGGPPAHVLCIASHAVPGDDVRLARAFAAFGARPLG